MNTTSTAIDPADAGSWSLIYAGVVEFNLTDDHRAADQARELVAAQATVHDATNYAFGYLTAEVGGLGRHPFATPARAAAVAAGLKQGIEDVWRCALVGEKGTHDRACKACASRA